MIDQKITPLWSSPHARFLSALFSATKQASPCCYNPLHAVAGKSLLPLLLLLLLLSIFFLILFMSFFLTQYLQRLTTKSFQIFSFSQTSLNSISIKIQTQITISKLIKVGRGIKKKKKFKANLTNLSRNKEEDNRWWGRG